MILYSQGAWGQRDHQDKQLATVSSSPHTNIAMRTSTLRCLTARHVHVSSREGAQRAARGTRRVAAYGVSVHAMHDA